MLINDLITFLFIRVCDKSCWSTLDNFCSIFVEFRLTVDITPVMGLNEILRNTLRSLSDENSLTSWSIYNENSGYISVKIRFKLATGAENHGAGLQYKRKSIKQANRDHERSKAWRATRQADGPGDHPGEVDKVTVVPKLTPPVDASAPHSTMHTRSMARTYCLDTPEMTRSQEPTLCQDIDTITVDSVILDTTREPQDVSLLSVGSSMSSPITAHTSNIPRHVDTPDVDLGTSVTSSSECVTPEGGDCRLVTGDRRVTSRDDVVQESSSRGSDASSDYDDGPPECLFCWYYDNDPGKCHKHG